MNLYQRSDDWQSSRVGKITASRIKSIGAKPQKGKALNATLLTLLSERLTGEVAEVFISKAMQWGIDNEPQAIASYENLTGQFVINCGLIDHPTIAMSGASPDGLVGNDGQIEVKCPETANHINTLLMRQVPEEYLLQITWQLACTGRKWCDFVSYDPRLKAPLDTVIIRVLASDLDIAAMESLVKSCNEQLDEAINKLNENMEQ